MRDESAAGENGVVTRLNGWGEGLRTSSPYPSKVVIYQKNV